MKSFGNVVLVVLAAIFLVSCAATPLVPPSYSYGKDEIHIDINADSSLNLNKGSAHTLLLCVHQFRDPNAYNRLAGDKNGIYQLLECSQFDSSVTHSKRIIVQPAQQAQYTLDRAEGTKYVAIVGGYYNVTKEDVTSLFEIPVIEQSSWIFFGSGVAETGKLNIKLDLGPRSLRGSTGQ
ncbi:MAG: type VI secretion system lipoprotein TssJ [Desulforhopalus sp.]|nr:type VI secretion system lipoprotein TssJ [Desulforhopalus sp.]